MSCSNCFRQCKIPLCGDTEQAVIARAGLHKWEEPCLSGTNGAGTVFFSGCNLRCVYCQNYEISSEKRGIPVSVERLREIYFELIKQGAHNIDLVTPMHYTKPVLESLEGGLPVPVINNTNGYESVKTLKRWEGFAQIYLPDLKYSDDAMAVRYSHAPGYFKAACAAIEEMYRQTGPCKFDENGLLKSGVIVRHLLLPGAWKNTQGVLDYIASTFDPGQILFSLMRQYVPHGRAADFPELMRRVTDEEYTRAVNYMTDSGITDGFVQEKESADTSFIPVFDGSGV